MTVDMQGFVLSELFWARLSWTGLFWPCFGGRWHSKLRKFLFSGGPLPIPALRHSPTANLGANTLESKLGCTSYVPAQETNLVYKIKRDICSIFWKYSRVSVNKGCETWWSCIWKTWKSSTEYQIQTMLRLRQNKSQILANLNLFFAPDSVFR